MKLLSFLAGVSAVSAASVSYVFDFPYSLSINNSYCSVSSGGEMLGEAVRNGLGLSTHIPIKLINDRILTLVKRKALYNLLASLFDRRKVLLSELQDNRAQNSFEGIGDEEEIDIDAIIKQLRDAVQDNYEGGLGSIIDISIAKLLVRKYELNDTHAQMLYEIVETPDSIESYSSAFKSDLKEIDNFFNSLIFELFLGPMFNSLKLNLGDFPSIAIGAALDPSNMGSKMCVSFEASTGEKEEYYECALLEIVRHLLLCATHSLEVNERPPLPENISSEELTLIGGCPKAEFSPDSDPNINRNDIEGLWRFGRYALSQQRLPAKGLIDGATLVARISYVETLNPLSPTNEVDFAALLQSNSSPNEFVLLLRGSLTQADWITDFDSGIIEIPDITNANKTLGLAHRGFTALATKVSQFVYEHFENFNSSVSRPRPSLRVVGHSLGGAVANVVSRQLGATNMFDSINTLTVGSPNVFAEADVGKRLIAIEEDEKVSTVSTRMNIISQTDPVPYFPCAKPNRLPECPKVASITPHGNAFAQLTDRVRIPPQLLSNLAPEIYDKIGTGSLVFHLFKFSMDATAFHLPTAINLPASHTCAYQCGLLAANYGLTECTKKACKECQG